MSIEPNESVIRGLKAKLVYESCNLICTPADRCTCDQVLEDISAANEWIDSWISPPTSHDLQLGIYKGKDFEVLGNQLDFEGKYLPQVQQKKSNKFFHLV